MPKIIKSSYVKILPIRKRIGKKVITNLSGDKKLKQLAREAKFQEEITKLCGRYPDLPMFLLYNCKVNISKNNVLHIPDKTSHFVLLNSLFIGDE